MRILVLGPIEDDISVNINDYDKVIAVDKGVYNAFKRGLKVDEAIGDFDSLGKNDEFLLDKINKVIRLNPIKDESDLEYTLNYLRNTNKKSDIDAIGFLYGNRLDHLLNNMLLLLKFSDLNLVFKSRKTLLYLFKKEDEFITKKDYKYISFFSFENAFIDLKKGFKYQVENELINLNTTKYISNELIENKGYINSSKDIIVMECND